MFTNAPVVETVLGVQFEPLRKLQSAHLGAFWKSLGDEWSVVTDAPAIEPQFERFGDAQAWGLQHLQLRLQHTIDIRLQIRNQTLDRMIQLQNGRLLYNWQSIVGGSYPRYENVRAEFDTIIDRWAEFVQASSLGEMKYNQWEVTYVNHIPRGVAWTCPADWTKLFQLPLQPPTTLDLVSLESFGGEWHFEVPPRRGRLHVRIQHGRASEGGELLAVTLTARGPMEAGADKVSLRNGLDCGHSAAVRTFEQITTDEAHRIWGRTDGDHN